MTHLTRAWAVAPALGLALVSGSTSSAATPPTEIVMVGRVPKDRGHLRCGLFDRQGWLKQPLQSATAVPEGRRGVCRFQLSAPGAYALGAYLDENDNGALDRDVVGYPKEPYGVSNGARIRFLRPPSFDAARVDYQGGELRLELVVE